MRALLAAALAALITSAPLSGSAASADAPAAPPPARAAVRLDQPEVVRRALISNATLRGARARAVGADAQAKSVRGRLLPALNVSEELQRWDSPFVITFPGLGDVTARDQSTTAFTASAGQPLLGLLHAGEDVAALGAAAGAAEADRRATEAAVKESVLTQLLQLFEARALGEIARASVEQLTEQLTVAQARLKAGVITRADVLRIETAVANAQQQVIQAAAQEEAGRGILLVAIGESPDAIQIDFSEPELPEPTPAPVIGDAFRAALSHRPELESARLSQKSAERRLSARTFDLLPEVNAEAAYMHVSGQAFQPEDAAFVGLKLEWPIWDWGAKWYERSVAAAQAEASAAQRDEARDRVAVEVSSRLAATRASANAVAVARTAIASAEEAYRVTGALVQAGSATTTDLLDAQAALTASRSNLARARYDYALTRVNLARAIGEL